LLAVVYVGVIGFLEVLLETHLLSLMLEGRGGTQAEIYLLDPVGAVVAVAGDDGGTLEGC
jgi:hypothetical protein